MSLVLEALQRVEKPGARTGSVGAAVSSYRPSRQPRSSAIPLLLGLLTGGASVLMLGTQPRVAGSMSAESDGAPSPADLTARPRKGRAGLPPPLILEPAARVAGVRRSPGNGMGPGSDVASRSATGPAGPPRPTEAAGGIRTTPALVLQAISERDSHPIAIINDQLVREGDRLGPVRVLGIGLDSVEVLLENGKKELVRFAPPPEASPSPRLF